MVDRTIGFIEHDMDRKVAVEPEQQQFKLEPQPQSSLHQDVSAPAREQVSGTTAAGAFSSNDQQRNGTTSDNGYYNSALVNQAAAYGAPVTYGQTTAGGQPSNNNGMQNVGPYDPSASAHYLYEPATSANSAPGIDQSASTSDPLNAFASQAIAQVSAGQAGSETDEWRQVQPQASLAAAAAAAAAQAHGNTSWHD